MSYKYIDSEKLEKRRKKSTQASGVLAIGIGLVIAACGVFFLVALQSLIGMLVMLLLALLFFAAGVYFFQQIAIEEKRSRALDDPTSKLYQQKQRKIEKHRARYLRKADRHGSLKTILCRRTAWIWGLSTIFAWLATVVLLLAGVLILVLFVFDGLLPIVFLSAFFGKQYRIMLREYAEYGMDKASVEHEFAASRAYLVSTDVIAVGSRFLTASKELVVLPMEEIVWIYCAYDAVHQYRNGMYAHTERTYCVMVGLADGTQVKIDCPEALCAVLMEDVRQVGISVVAGYSDALREQFHRDAAHISTAATMGSQIQLAPVQL